MLRVIGYVLIVIFVFALLAFSCAAGVYAGIRQNEREK